MEKSKFSVVFPQIFQQTGGLQLWRPNRKKIFQRARTLSPTVRNWWNFWNLIWTNFFLKTLPLDIWVAVLTTLGKKIAKKPERSWSNSENTKKVLSFSKNICFKKNYMHTYNAVLTTTSENFWQEQTSFFLHVRGW